MTRHASEEDASPGPAEVKPRRSHKKSRTGCKECKGRHIKCDERRPACFNCSNSGRQCSYLTFDPARSKRGLLSSGRSASSRSLQNSATSPSVSSELRELILPNDAPAEIRPEDGQVFTIHHLALLHHAETNMSSNFLLTDDVYAPFIAMTIESAFAAPYLMDELLALSALHLSTVHQSRQDYYRHQATQLQTRALSLFTQAKEDISDENCIPMFFFSALLGLDILCNTLRNYRTDFNDFLDHFIAYIHLHRGVRAVTNAKWHIIKDSKLKPFVDFADSADSLEGPGIECEGLHQMINTADLGPASADACRSALKTLQWSFNFYHHLEQGGRQVHAVPAFPITVAEEYIDVLKQRRPEALVILAYYAVMLHWNRDVWLIGDGGQYLIQAITSHLGTYWKEWLEWPKSMLSDQSFDQLSISPVSGRSAVED